MDSTDDQPLPDIVPRKRAARFMSRILATLAILAPTTFVALMIAPTPAYAYVGGSAASYADYWWNGRNPNYYTGLSADCTNFVSQAMHDPYGGGNFAYVGTPSGYGTSDNAQWWMHWDPIWQDFSWSNSFVRVQDLYAFLMGRYPGGWWKGTAHTLAQQQATYTPNDVVTGDLLFYDWNSDGTKDHVAIQVGWGTDPTSQWYGNYQDQHTTDRYHAFWSLLPYNSQWPTTTITFVHVDHRN